MKAGKLRHKITIQKRVDTQDAYGYPVATWSTRVAVWAMIEPLSGREGEFARGIVATATHKITTRYGCGTITTADRILYGNRYFAILAVLNIGERNVELQLLCSEECS